MMKIVATYRRYFGFLLIAIILFILGATVKTTEIKKETHAMDFEKTNQLDFDLELWKKRIPVESLKHEELEGDTIAGPRQLLSVLYGREASKVDASLMKSFPTDVFVLGLGEPEIPWQTKIGGVPYRPKDLAWPMDGAEPYCFLAQFCFRESQDLFDFKLPGDLLLAFVTRFPENDKDYFEFVFEWYNIDEIQALATKSDVPDQGLLQAGNFGESSLQPCCWYGQRVRTVDYINDKTHFFPQFSDADEPASNLHILRGTKIGGSADDILQNSFGCESIEDLNDEEKMEYQKIQDACFLCRVYSIWPNPCKTYSFLNKAEPFSQNFRDGVGNRQFNNSALCFFDVGYFDFFITSDNKIFWYFISG